MTYKHGKLMTGVKPHRRSPFIRKRAHDIAGPGVF